MDREAKLKELMGIVSRDVTDLCTNQSQHCTDACLDTIAMVSSHKRIQAVCLHEAGHFAESVSLGIMVGFTEKDIGYHAPRVIYSPESLAENKFESNPGSIYTPFKALELSWTLPILQQAARVAVAGGVYAHVLADRPIDEGTGGDWNLYTTYYRIALKTLHKHLDLLVATKLWDWAIKKVTEDLNKNSELENNARKKAAQFTHDFYRPFVEFCDLIH
jgi:hypothetical protein